MTFRKFKVSSQNLQKLSSQEKKLLFALSDIVEEFSKVYEIQLKDGFYPKTISRYELEIAALKDKSIVSPFTFVFKKNGQLKAVPYHIKYAEILQPIAKKILEAEKLSTNPSFTKYLHKRAKSLIDGSYRDADIAWLNVKNSKIDFSIGPFERYLDKRLFIKRSFQAHAGVIDEQATKQGEQIKEVLYQTAKLSVNDFRHSTEIPIKGVQILVEETTATTGYMSQALFSGEHFPCDLDLMEKYGAKILIYDTQLQLKFEKLYYPIFNAIFESKFASKYSKQLLLKSTRLHIILHELTRQLHKFKGSRERLKELYGIIDEGNAAVSDIEHSKYLLVKGVINQDEMEAIMIIQLCWMLSYWVSYQKDKSVESYVKAGSIILTYYLLNGALSLQDGISWPNFPKIFFETETLAHIMSNILQQSSYFEAEKFIKLMARTQNFQKVSKNLGQIA